MTFYDKSIIYKIKHNEDYDDTNIYVGSTSNFKQRKYKHKSNCNNEKDKKYNIPIYQYIRANGGWDEWVMIPIEPYPCNSIIELEIRERYYIDILRPTLNKQLPTRTQKEYYENNKEQIIERNKKYNKNNKEKIKQYYEDNKEQIIEISKKRYEANKEQIAERQNEKVICDHCGCYSTKTNLKRHQKTKKCINFVKI